MESFWNKISRKKKNLYYFVSICIFIFRRSNYYLSCWSKIIYTQIFFSTVFPIINTNKNITSNPTSKMTDKEALRQTALADSDALGTKQRFGLFSHPISTAIGDDGPYKTKLHPRGDQGKGKPITDPKNFYSGPCRSGQLRKSYLGDLNSLAASDVKDQYVDPARRLIQQQNQLFRKGLKNENKFKHASFTGSDILWRSSYPYTDSKQPEKDPKRNREPDGRVKSKPRNAQTNPQSKVIATYFKPQKHLEDPYDRAHQLQLEQMRKDKALEGEAKFKPNSFHPSTFNKDIKIYGEDVQLKAKSPRQTQFNIFKHQAKWKGTSPNKHGLYGYLQPFPTYMENPPREIKRKPSAEKKDVFKGMSCTLTTPSASITGHPSNMRRYISHSFSHRM